MIHYDKTVQRYKTWKTKSRKGANPTWNTHLDLGIINCLQIQAIGFHIKQKRNFKHQWFGETYISVHDLINKQCTPSWYTLAAHSTMKQHKVSTFEIIC